MSVKGYGFVLLGLACLGVLPSVAARLLHNGVGGAAGPEESIRPRWQVGDRWTVEAATRPVQSTLAGPEQRVVVRWEFEVASREPLDGRECFRIEAVPDAGPPSTLWVDRQTLRVCQIRVGTVVGGQVRAITESYATAGAQAAPMISPLPAVPVDLPAFPTGQTKGLDTFSYEAVPGPAGHKAVGQVGFQVTVEQQFTAPSDPQVKGLADDPFVKGLAVQPAVGVRLKGPHGVVRQFWKPGVPWPICSENGTTTSRLVEFKPAGNAGEVQR